MPESKIIPVSAAEHYNLVHLVDEIVFALPKDKKITFVENVKDDKRSEQAKNSAEKGFWETAVEFINRCDSFTIKSSSGRNWARN